MDRDREAKKLLPYARATARGLARLGGAPVEELESAAMVGLAQAINTYAPGRGATLKTWVGTKVRSACLDAQRKWAPLGKRARNRSHGRKLGDVWRDCQVLGVEGAAGVHGLSPCLVRAMTKPHLEVSLDELRDSLEERRPHVPDREDLDDLWRRLEPLVRPRDLALLKLRFSGQGRSLREVSTLMGVSESRVCQLLSRIMLRLGIDRDLFRVKRGPMPPGGQGREAPRTGACPRR